MAEYVALLRAINVGAKNRITMEELRRIFLSLGTKSVTTYLQSGNVRFEVASAGRAAIKRDLEGALSRRFKGEMTAVLRTPEELREVVEDSPFMRRIPRGASPYVTFLERAVKFEGPTVSPRKDIEVIHARPGEIFCVGRLVKGRSGNPNAFIEKQLHTKATTRNWKVTKALAAGGSNASRSSKS